MSYQLQKLDKSQVALTVTVSPAEYQKDLEAAAARLSERAAIKGFRPGKAPYELIKQQLGEGMIMQEAAEAVVQKKFFLAVKQEGLETIGAPQISIEKLAPGNDLVFKAVVALLPRVKLADFSKIDVKREAKPVTEEKVGEVLNNLKKLQPKETLKAGAAAKEDKVVIDMDMFIEKIPIEGGQAKGHQVYLSEPHYIPGLAEQLVGLKKNDTKEFKLDFPKDHYQKHLAGRLVDFKIIVQDVYLLEYPALDDDFAKSLGQESMKKLKFLLTENLTNEAEQKEDQRLEAAMLDQLIAKSEFEEIPEILIDSEKRKMFAELKHSLNERGIEIEKYLADLKKTEEEIFNDFTQNGIKRAKAALISRQVAAQNNIKVSKEELDRETEAIKQSYPNDSEMAERLAHPEVRETIAATVQNRKVIQFLKNKILSPK